MNYLTRIQVPKPQIASLRLHHSYAWHAELCKAFREPEDKSPFLFRFDDEHESVRVHVLSERAPQIQTWGQWELKEIADSFLEYHSYHFKLKANPTKRRPDDKTRSRKRFGIYNDKELKEWIVRKAIQHGFVIDPDTLQISKPTDQYFVRNQIRGKHVSVDFNGLLKVSDRDVFIKAFKMGIGSAKAFGFGLLMLVPAQ